MNFNVELDPKYCRCKTDKDKPCIMMLSESGEFDDEKLWFNTCVWDEIQDTERLPECIEMESKQVKVNIT